MVILYSYGGYSLAAVIIFYKIIDFHGTWAKMAHSCRFWRELNPVQTSAYSSNSCVFRMFIVWFFKICVAATFCLINSKKVYKRNKLAYLL